MSSYLQVYVYLSTHYRILFKHICSLLAEVFSTAVLVNSIMKCVGKVWVLHEQWKSHRKLRHRFLLESHMKASAWLQRFAKAARNLHISFKFNISVVHVCDIIQELVLILIFWLARSRILICRRSAPLASIPLCSASKLQQELQYFVTGSAESPTSRRPLRWLPKKYPCTWVVCHLSLSRLCFNPIGPPISQLIFTSEHFEHLWEMQDGKGMYSSKKCDVLEITCKSMQIL